MSNTSQTTNQINNVNKSTNAISVNATNVNATNVNSTNVNATTGTGGISGIISSIGNKTSNTVKISGEYIKGLSTPMKIALIIAIICMLGGIYYIVRIYRNQRIEAQFKNNPVFITNIHDARTVYCYNNQPQIPTDLMKEINGNQCAYSFWLNVYADKYNYRLGKWKHVLHRGSRPSHYNGVSCNKTDEKDTIENLMIQAPGVYLSPSLNQLVIEFSSSETDEKITIENIELSTWINISITIDDQSIGVYRNGELEKTVILHNPITNNKGNMYVGYFGGFYGGISTLQFFNKSTTPETIRENYRTTRKIIESYAGTANVSKKNTSHNEAVKSINSRINNE